MTDDASATTEMQILSGRRFPVAQLKIESFLGAQTLELNRLGRINIIAGANGCGKTTVLEYIGDHAECPVFKAIPMKGFSFPQSSQECSECLEILSFLKTADSRLVPGRKLGSGAGQLLQMAVGVIQSRNGVLLIDNAEFGLCEDVLNKAFAWIVHRAIKYNVQVFLTTHSHALVDALIYATRSDCGTPEDESSDGVDSDLMLYRIEPRDQEIRVVEHSRSCLTQLREMGQNVLS